MFKEKMLQTMLQSSLTCQRQQKSNERHEKDENRRLFKLTFYV